MTFEEFIEFGEKETGSKIDGQVKELIKIMFDNLKSGAWSEDDLNDFINIVETEQSKRRKGVNNV